MALPSWVKNSALAGSLIAAFSMVGIIDIELAQRQSAARIALPVEAYNLPTSQTLRALSFGYNEVIADLLWVRTIIYFTEHLDTDRDLRHLERHLKNILALDEHFKAIYRFGSSMLMSRGTASTNEDVLAAIRILEQGHKNFPEESSYPFHISAYYISELKTNSPEERRRWRRLGADWIHRAALIGLDLPWLPSLAARIYTEQGERDLAIRHLHELYLTTQDKEMKVQISLKLKQMKANQLTAELARTSRAFDEKFQGSQVPYISADLFIILGIEPEEPFSVERLFQARE